MEIEYNYINRHGITNNHKYIYNKISIYKPVSYLLFVIKSYRNN
jgi:hypothetical protein